MDEVKMKHLPPGWVVKQSKSYPDRVYYFNVNSGLSSWEFPDILEGLSNNNSAGATSMTIPPITPTVVKPSPVPTLKPGSSHVSTVKSGVSKPGTSNSSSTDVIAGSKSGACGVSNAETPSNRTMLNPDLNHTFRGRSAHRGTQNLTKSKRVSSESLEKVRTNLCHNSNTANPPEVLNKKLKVSPSNKGSIVSTMPRTKTATSSLKNKNTPKCDLISKQEKPSGVKNCVISSKTQRQSASASSSAMSKQTMISNGNVATTNKSSEDKLVNRKSTTNTKNQPSPIRTRFNNKTKVGQDKIPENRSSQSLKNKDPANKTSPELKRSDLNKHSKGEHANKQTPITGPNLKSKPTPNSVKTVCSSKLVVNTSKSVVEVKSDTKVTPVGNKEPNHSKLRDKYASDIPKTTKGSKLAHATNSKPLKAPPTKVTEKVKNVKEKTEETITDLRKVVRKMQESLYNPNRDVTLKDARINNNNLKQTYNSATFTRQNSTSLTFQGNNDLSVQTRINSESPVNFNEVPSAVEPVFTNTDIEDSCKNTEFKVFIGDKNKLLDIQAWINNLQDGSVSNSPSQSDIISNVDESVDSGYLSPPTERGWPGKLNKQPDIASREIVAMEIDECFIPSPNDKFGGDLDRLSHDLEQVEDMDIDEVLIEVRNQVRNDRTISVHSPIAWSEIKHEDAATTVEKVIVVVLDTNVIIQNLALLKNLKGYTLKGAIKPTLYIPWIVLCELDRLKIRKNQPSVMELARKGITFLKDMLVKNHPRVIGQTPKQSQEASETFKSDCNDDMILQACLQCKQKYDHVVLFTNDNNLSVKSLVMGITTANAKGIYDELRKVAENLCKTVTQSNGYVVNSNPNTPVLNNQSRLTSNHTPIAGNQNGLVQNQNFIPITNQPCGAVSSPPARLGTSSSSMIPMPPSPQEVKHCNQSKGQRSSVEATLPVHKPTPKHSLATRILQEEKTYSEEMLIDDVICKFKDVLKQSLSEVLKTEMEGIYDTIWLQIVYKKPPWSLSDVLICLQKHWRAVFSDVLGRHNEMYMDNLINSTAKVKVHRMIDLLDMVNDGYVILELANKTKKYGQEVLHAYNTVSTLKHLCEQIVRQEINVSSIQSLDQYLHSKQNIDSSINKEPALASTSSSNTSHIDNHSKNTSVINKNTKPLNGASSHSSVQSSMINKVNQPGSSQIPQSTLSVGQNVPQTGIQQNVPQTSAILNVPQTCIQQNVPQTCIQQNVPQTCAIQNVPQACANGVNSNGDASNSDNQEMVAGERFSTIWKFIYRYCEQFNQSVIIADPSADVKKEVESMLLTLVPVVIELRKYYVGLLDLPVTALTNHEKEFTEFSKICNSFFTQLKVKEEVPATQVTALHLLVLYSKSEYRSTLNRFHQQLDEMLNLMYQCLNKICPDD